MSWTLNVPVTARADFADAVAAAEPTVRQIDASGELASGVAEAVDAAKDALNALSVFIKRDYLVASASGHVLQPDEGDNWSDSVSVNVYGVVKSAD